MFDFIFSFWTTNLLMSWNSYRSFEERTNYLSWYFFCWIKNEHWAYSSIKWVGRKLLERKSLDASFDSYIWFKVPLPYLTSEVCPECLAWELSIQWNETSNGRRPCSNYVKVMQGLGKRDDQDGFLITPKIHYLATTVHLKW